MVEDIPRLIPFFLVGTAIQFLGSGTLSLLGAAREPNVVSSYLQLVIIGRLVNREI